MKIVKRYISAQQEVDAFTFQIPVTWQMKTVLSVDAYSLEEAIQIINNHEYELAKGELVTDSFEIDYDRLDD